MRISGSNNDPRPIKPGYVVGKVDAPWNQRLVVVVTQNDDIGWVRPEAINPETLNLARPRDVSFCGRRRFVTWSSGMDELRLPRDEDRMEFDEGFVLTPVYFQDPYVV